MSEPVTLESVLGGLRHDAALAKLYGAGVSAMLLTRAADAIEAAAEPFLLWLSETEAMLRSNHGVAWFRARRNQWQADGHARKGPKGWQYRAVVVPRRGNHHAAYEAGRRAGESAA